MTPTSAGKPDDSGEFEAIIAAMLDASLARPGSFRAGTRLRPVDHGDIDVVVWDKTDPSQVSVLVECKQLTPEARPDSPARHARVSPQRLTRLAVLIAGRRRASIGCEWRSHLAGETGTGLPEGRQARVAAGFVAAALRCRLQDLDDIAWKPVDAILASRELSGLVALLATLAAVVISIHGDGVYGLVSNLGNTAVVWGMTYGLIRAGRWWRGVKPAERKSRRSTGERE